MVLLIGKLGVMRIVVWVSKVRDIAPLVKECRVHDVVFGQRQRRGGNRLTGAVSDDSPPRLDYII